jgi:2-polyprenyl-3-methyl-5-hydroxy-6-metoxy-1,4-benzoquinol methylase
MEISTAICYEEESASSFAYYSELGVYLNEKQYQRPPVVLDLCAGGGGMSRGLADAGFNVKYKV